MELLYALAEAILLEVDNVEEVIYIEKAESSFEILMNDGKQYIVELKEL